MNVDYKTCHICHLVIILFLSGNYITKVTKQT